MNWESMITVGRIVRPHGHKGAVVVQPETDFAEDRFRVGAELRWCRNGAVERVRLAASREFRGRWVVSFDGVTTMTDAESLRGLELRVPADALHELAEGSHYVHDLVGCQVFTVAGDSVGTVGRVDFGSGTPLLVVSAVSGDEVFVPLAEEICRAIDTAGKRIVVALPDGLLELNANGRAGRRR